MKRLLSVASAVVLFLCFHFSAFAEIRESDLNKNAVLTEEARLLQQVDTVSIYLSSNRVAFAPRLTQNKIIEVETTVLARDLISNRAKMKEFLNRLIGTYLKVLDERLPIYAPSVAAKFDADKDIIFIVNAGGSRVPVGVWKGGGWVGDSVANIAAPVAAPAAVPVVAEPKVFSDEVFVSVEKSANVSAVPETVVKASDTVSTSVADAGVSEIYETETIEVKEYPPESGRKGCSCPARR